jgi:hypothetical protein
MFPLLVRVEDGHPSGLSLHVAGIYPLIQFNGVKEWRRRYDTLTDFVRPLPCNRRLTISP